MKRFKSILVVLTEDSLAEVAFERALRLAQSHGAVLTLVDVVEPSTMRDGAAPVAERSENFLSSHRGRLAGFGARASDAGVEVSEALLQGEPFVEIVRMVLRERHDLVIKGATPGAQGQGPLHGLDLHILRDCPCPVWMLSDPKAGAFSAVLAAVGADQSAYDTEAGVDHLVLDLASSLAAHEDAPLHVAHSFRTETDQDVLNAPNLLSRDAADLRLQNLLKCFPHVPRARQHLLEGRPGDAFASLAKTTKADLIVVGAATQSERGAASMDERAERILQATKCALLAVKPDGFECPVTLNGQ